MKFWCNLSMLIGIILLLVGYDNIYRNSEMKIMKGGLEMITSALFFGIGLIGLILLKQNDKPESGKE